MEFTDNLNWGRVRQRGAEHEAPPRPLGPMPAAVLPSVGGSTGGREAGSRLPPAPRPLADRFTVTGSQRSTRPQDVTARSRPRASPADAFCSSTQVSPAVGLPVSEEGASMAMAVASWVGLSALSLRPTAALDRRSSGKSHQERRSASPPLRHRYPRTSWRLLCLDQRGPRPARHADLLPDWCVRGWNSRLSISPIANTASANPASHESGPAASTIRPSSTSPFTHAW